MAIIEPKRSRSIESRAAPIHRAARATEVHRLRTANRRESTAFTCEGNLPGSRTNGSGEARKSISAERKVRPGECIEGGLCKVAAKLQITRSRKPIGEIDRARIDRRSPSVVVECVVDLENWCLLCVVPLIKLQSTSAGDLAGDTEGFIRPTSADVVHARAVQVDLTGQGIVNRAAADRTCKCAAVGKAIQCNNVRVGCGSRSSEEIQLSASSHVDRGVWKDCARANHSLNHKCASIYVDRAGRQRARPGEDQVAQTSLGKANAVIHQRLVVGEITSVVVVKLQRTRATQRNRRSEPSRVLQYEFAPSHARRAGVSDDVVARLRIDAGERQRSCARFGQSEDASLVAHTAIERRVRTCGIHGQRAGSSAARFKVLDDSTRADIAAKALDRLVEAVKLELGVECLTGEIDDYIGRHLIAGTESQQRAIGGPKYALRPVITNIHHSAGNRLTGALQAEFARFNRGRTCVGVDAGEHQGTACPERRRSATSGDIALCLRKRESRTAIADDTANGKCRGLYDADACIRAECDIAGEDVRQCAAAGLQGTAVLRSARAGRGEQNWLPFSVQCD